MIKSSFLFFLFLVLLMGCSRTAIMKMMTKSPEIATFNARDYPQYNDYQLDLEYLRHFIKSAYPRLETKISIAALDSIFQQNIALAANVTDAGFDLLLNRVMTPLRDVHSCYEVDYSKLDTAYFYLYLVFENGYWYINNLDESKPTTRLGSKLIELNGVSADSLDRLIQLNVCGETIDSRRWAYIRRQRFPTFLNQVGVDNNQNWITIKSQKQNVVVVDTVYARGAGKYHVLSNKRITPSYLYQQNNGFYHTIDTVNGIGYFQMNTCLDYVSIKSEIKDYTSFFVRPLAKVYLKKQTTDARDFGRAVASFFKEVEDNKIKNIILDLRNNRGGDERTGKQFLWYLAEARAKELRGFTDYVHYSEYFQMMVKKEAVEVSKLYETKYGIAPAIGTEINITDLTSNHSYFDDITTTDGKFYLDSTINRFDGYLYVMTSQYTNSAAQVLATTIADNNLGKVIGIPPGNTPTTQTGALIFKLPKTKRILSLSYYFMERPDGSKHAEKELQLDKVVYQTYQDLLAGRNTVFEYILTEIHHK